MSVIISFSPVPSTSKNSCDSEPPLRKRKLSSIAAPDQQSLHYELPDSLQLKIRLLPAKTEYAILLPSPAATGQSGQLSIEGKDHIAIRLQGLAGEPLPSPTVQLPSSHLEASHLSASQPGSFVCGACSAPIIASASSEPIDYIALPSEHWEELIDSWMCHGDQLLNDSVTRGREGLAEGATIGPNQVRVADNHLVFPSKAVLEGSIKTSRIELAEMVSSKTCFRLQRSQHRIKRRSTSSHPTDEVL